MNRKAVILNYTGTVGKTTLAVNLLYPRMVGATFYAIESINETGQDLGVDVVKLRGDNFRELFKRFMIDDHAIVDVGASNVEDFMRNLEGFEDAHEEIDYYVIPVTSGTKEQKETLTMIESLAALGVPPEKIRIIFNRVRRDVKDEFPIIFNYQAIKQSFWINPDCSVFESELFDALSIHKMSMATLLNDDNDYKSMLKTHTATPQERSRWSDMYGLKLLARGVNRKLDFVFDQLFVEA
ncbi:StbB family protein [Pseudomonas kitaguniensis]|uniref:StbB family protein n=1 Tax=Pseudomonas kitaguniensis TaxID=2607908 RepID=UPI003B9DFC9F